MAIIYIYICTWLNGVFLQGWLWALQIFILYSYRLYRKDIASLTLFLHQYNCVTGIKYTSELNCHAINNLHVIAYIYKYLTYWRFSEPIVLLSRPLTTFIAHFLLNGVLQFIFLSLEASYTSLIPALVAIRYIHKCTWLIGVFLQWWLWALQIFISYS